ncbi:MAG: hypothetical protein IPK19_38195 [Chloroflexi bacterium]|nr:hypothetical protein [Chloroflexota bacterium]
MTNTNSDPELLAQRLDQVLPANSAAIPPRTPDPLVNTGVAIARLPVRRLSPATTVRVQMRMMEAYDREFVHPRKPIRRFSQVASQLALVASVALVVLIVGLRPAVANSLPGEPFYSVKRTVEGIELALTADDTARTTVILQQARTRRTKRWLSWSGGSSTRCSSSMLSKVPGVHAGVLAEEVANSVRLQSLSSQTAFVLTAVIDSAEDAGLARAEDVAALTARVNAAFPGASGRGNGRGNANGSGNSSDGMPPRDGSERPAVTPRGTESEGSPSQVPEATATPSPRAGNTRQPTHTPRPTNEHRPTAEPEATRTPRPTNTHRPPENPGEPPETPPGQGNPPQTPPGQGDLPHTPPGQGDNPGNPNPPGGGEGKP